MSLEIVSFQGFDIEIDREQTDALYSRCDWGCQCVTCTNYYMTRVNFTPFEQFEKIRSFGLNFLNPLHVVPWQHFPSDPKGSTRTRCCWHLVGKMPYDVPSLEMRFSKWNKLTLTRFRPRKGWILLDGEDQEDQKLIYLTSSNLYQWLPGEMCSVRMEYTGERCSRCGDKNRLTGYLKRHSLIPGWFNLPELKQVLLAHRDRVFVQFCTRCGVMEHRIVENRPPFLRRNPIDRAHRKAWKATWDWSGDEPVYKGPLGSDVEAS